MTDESATTPILKPKRSTKAQRPLVSFDPRMIDLLLQAAAGKKIVILAEPEGIVPDPDFPNRAKLSLAGRIRMRQLFRLRNRLWELRKRMRETNHPLAEEVYRAEVVLYRDSWPKDRGMHPKAASLEIRPSDSYIDDLLQEAIGPRPVSPIASPDRPTAATPLDDSFLGPLLEEDTKP